MWFIGDDFEYIETMRASSVALLLLAVLGMDCSSDSPLPSNFPVKNPAEVTPAQTPTSGPYFHTLRTASSTDGLTWTEDRTIDLVLHASVPAAVQLNDGTLVVYFVDFSSGSPERLGCVVSKDDGATFTWGNCSLSGLTSNKAVDFAPFLLQDTSVRLYFYASDVNVNSVGAHPIDYATSSDGISFLRIGTVFSYDGLVDPDIFYNGTDWIMHVFSLTDGATVRATSLDGLNFTYLDALQPTHYGVTKPVLLSDGSFRMYGFPQGANQQNRFVSMHASDGLVWTLEPGNRLVAPTGYETTDPYVIQLATGKWFMVYKRSPA